MTEDYDNRSPQTIPLKTIKKLQTLQSCSYERKVQIGIVNILIKTSGQNLQAILFACFSFFLLYCFLIMRH